jgi:membrane-bound lytic murein transglycosylase D
MKKNALLIILLCLTACQQTPDISATKPKAVEINKEESALFTEVELIEKSTETLIAKQPFEHDDVWQRIRSQLTIAVPDNARVEKWRKYYLSHPNFMVTISKRAEPFLLYIVEELEKRNMPVELALLPIVESSYLPHGLSNKNAVGLWQFTPVAAERFNLDNNWWYEGRRDVAESTRAALDYFEFFHRTLGQDWLNAIAAFNSGEGRVGRAIKKNKKSNLPSDFWSLKLPSETSDFVPKLLAIADILKRSKELNYTFTPIQNSPAVELININSQLDLTLAAKWANIEVHKLLRLNPGLNRWATAPNIPYQMLLPAAAADSFKSKLTTTHKKEWLQWDRYQVKSGDSLGKIANQYIIDVKSIKKLNQLNSDIIRIGQWLIVPLTKNDSLPWQLAKTNKKKLIYTVRSGDNLWDISQKYKVRVQDIIRWNKIASNSFLQPKQKLAILL